MSNSSRHLMIAIALLLLGAAGPGLLLAKGPPTTGDITVVSATPDFAEQGEQNKGIVLAGTNFPTYSKIKFPKDDLLCEGVDSDVTLVQEVVKRTSSTTLEFNINVPVTAELGYYDICVYETDRFGTLSGRKGKGTTKLFTVKEKGNPNEGVFTPVEITAEIHEVDVTDAVEYASPYTGETHPWTGSSEQLGGKRQSFFEYEGAYNFDFWDDNELFEVPRRCQAGYAGNPPTGGRYDCFGPDDEVLNHGGLISIPLSCMTWVNVTYSKNGDLIDDQGFCALLDEMSGEWSNGECVNSDFLEFGATRYSVWFHDGCPNEYGKCPIEVRMLSYSGSGGRNSGGNVQLHPFHDLPDRMPDIGRMPLTGFVYGMPDMEGLDADELNVFTLPQDLRIGKFRISFYAVKNGSLVATCETELPEQVEIRIKTTPWP